MCALKQSPVVLVCQHLFNCQMKQQQKIIYANVYRNTINDGDSQTSPQGPEEMCLSLEHQNPSKTSGKMGYFDRVDDRVTVPLHILCTANQETEGSQDRLTV